MKTNKRHAEAMPHIEHIEYVVTRLRCSICDVEQAIGGPNLERQEFDFLTAHRHKDVKSLPKEL